MHGRSRSKLLSHARCCCQEEASRRRCVLSRVRSVSSMHHVNWLECLHIRSRHLQRPAHGARASTNASTEGLRVMSHTDPIPLVEEPLSVTLGGRRNAACVRQERHMIHLRVLSGYIQWATTRSCTLSTSILLCSTDKDLTLSSFGT